MAKLQRMELAEALRVKLASEGMEVSDLAAEGKYKGSFTIRLEDDEKEGDYQVYRITTAIPHGKDFKLAEDWEDWQEPDDPFPEPDDDPEE